MNLRALSIGCVFCIATAPWVFGVDHVVATLSETAPKDQLSPEVAGQLAATGVRVSRGADAFCDLWLCKSLPAVSGFKPTPDILYPLTPGQLIGVARFARKGSDFRDQDIQPGVYTLRYSQQPVDGSHVGTSPTRDFLLLSQAAKDRSPAVLEYKGLTKQSAEAAGSSHPALLCLQPPAAGAGESPSVRHEDQRDWWIVSIRGEMKSDGAAKPLLIGIVVVGLAPAQ